MAAARTNPLPDLARYVIRPTLVEARLLNEKHACDAGYLVGLAQQLRNVEVKIAALEQALRLDPSATDKWLENVSGSQVDINWIRAKSSQLGCRLRRLEESCTHRKA